MKIIVFGTGRFYQNRKNAFSSLAVEISAFLDNDPNKQGQVLDGAPILSPSEVKDHPFDCVCIMSDYAIFPEMKQQLLDLNVPEGKIVSYDEFRALFAVNTSHLLYNNFCADALFPTTGKRVLLFSHELSLTGAPVVLFYMAQMLKKNGYCPIVVSPLDGPLSARFIEEGIPVFVTPFISGKNETLLRWMRTFDLIVICTLTFGQFVGELGEDFPVPVLWWLHEGTEVYSGWWPRAKPRVLSKNVHIYAVGSRALRVYEEHFQNQDAKPLLYGLPDTNPHPEEGFRPRPADKKLTFALIGTVQARKGQDLFLEAIQLLSEQERAQAEFLLIGPWTDSVYPEFNQKIREMAAAIPEVQLMGPLSMDQMDAIYPQIDVVISPSRDDPMPVVLPEAMRFYKTCITSVETGTASVIQDGVNGLICQVDAQDIAEKMRWILQHQDRLKDLGCNGRKLYEDTFSLNAFEKKALQAVEECLHSQD